VGLRLLIADVIRTCRLGNLKKRSRKRVNVEQVLKLQTGLVALCPSDDGCMPTDRSQI